MEGLGFAEVLSHIIRQLFQLLVDLSHELLPIIKVPFKKGIDVSLFGSVCFTITFIILPTIINAKLPCLIQLNSVLLRPDVSWFDVISCSIHSYHHSYMFGHMLHYKIRHETLKASIQITGRLSSRGDGTSIPFSLLEQFVRCCEELSASVDELQQISPALIDAVLPLRHAGCLCVAGFDQLVYRLVDHVNSLLPRHPRLPRKLPELIPQKLKGKI